jgi:hypothetical protein
LKWDAVTFIHCECEVNFGGQVENLKTFAWAARGLRHPNDHTEERSLTSLGVTIAFVVGTRARCETGALGFAF